MISPHGGKLVNNVLKYSEKKKILRNIKKYKAIELDEEQIKEVKNIARGVYSPITGFLKKEDFESVVKNMRLVSGIVWPIPVVLDINDREYKKIKSQRDILLLDEHKNPVSLLKDIEIYKNNKDFFTKNVFGTKDKAHPGVDAVYKMDGYLVGGEISLIDDSKHPFPELNFTPIETRKKFTSKGWKKIVAFQTRNVPHRGHEYLQKEALKIVDGAFIQPVIGEKKLGDFKDEYTLSAYRVLIDNFYPKNKVILGILPLKMKYAGPREAVLHALVRKNFGATHFIVGRDHAGVGDYYSPFAAQEIFDQFKSSEIGVKILKYGEVIYCEECGDHRFRSACKHRDESKISFSGTKLRDNLINKEQPPFYIIRPEVYNLLYNSYNSLVDHMYKKPTSNKQKGFTLWFTGLSQSGKTTLADKVESILRKKGIKLEQLDGDVVREHLSKDLGFSKKDRDENIKRVGFVAGLLSRNSIGVLASFISPYRKQREGVRKQTKNFIEVYCNASVEVCEARDKKGLYKKARAGEIKNFTGISDPYETPKKPEIELHTGDESVEESTRKIIKYLKKNKFV